MKSFKDKVVVITGGATGIGFSFAKRFAAEGAKLVIAARRKERLEKAETELRDLGAETHHFVCDVTKVEDVEALADFAWKQFGNVDAIVNNAGMMSPQAPLIDVAFADVSRVFDVNFFGVWYGSAIFGKRFVEQGTPAAIYNIGSENSLFHGVPYGGAYVATKHAVLALTESLREEMPDFVDVGLICPGFVRSEIGPDDAMSAGMDTDKYTDIAMSQIKNGEFFIVSHAYNIERINARHKEITEAYERYAPRYDGDNEFDVRTIIESRMS